MTDIEAIRERQKYLFEHYSNEPNDIRHEAACDIGYLLAEIDRLSKLRQWQPIETAPLDKLVLCWWRPKTDNKYAECAITAVVSSHESGKYWDGELHDLWHLTHWQPLPEPPQQREGSGE